MIIKTGYYNWNQFGLKDNFYPDDMPIEWRLTFYANEIECVLISLADLSEVDDFDDVFEDLPESFDVLLQYDAEDQVPLVKELIKNEDVNVKALICADDCYQNNDNISSKLSLASFKLSDKKTLSFSSGLKVSQLLVDSVNIVFVDEVLTLKQFRSFIDDWVALNEQESLYLMLDAGGYNSAFAGQLRIMIEMMGH